MVLQHLSGFRVYERIDLDSGCSVLERREYWGGQQDVAVVAQLNHQRAPQPGYVDRIGGAVVHAAHDSREPGQRQPVVAGTYLNAYSALANSVRPACG